MTTVHVRKIDRRASKRIGGAPGVSHALCGGAVTEWDIVWKNVSTDAKLEKELAFLTTQGRQMCFGCLNEVTAAHLLRDFKKDMEG